MPVFSYIARTANGQISRGTIAAATAEAAREQLRKSDLFVEEIRIAPDEHPPLSPHSVQWEEQQNTTTVHSPFAYAPLLETLQLFAGWLLAWYGLVYALGSYQFQRELPWEIPFVENLFLSPLVLRLAFGTFLFLFLTTLHRWLGGGPIRGFLLAISGVIILALFHINA